MSGWARVRPIVERYAENKKSQDFLVSPLKTENGEIKFSDARLETALDCMGECREQVCTAYSRAIVIQ